MKKQFIISEGNTDKRKEFYEFIHKNFELKDRMPKEKMIENAFPFVVDFNDNSFWVCESITCCACAAQTKQIIKIDEFKSLIKERKN